MNTPLSPVSGRLASLDILRGFDLFLLVFFQPVFVALGQRLNFPWLNDILYQFDHESWIGFRFSCIKEGVHNELWLTESRGIGDFILEIGRAHV